MINKKVAIVTGAARGIGFGIAKKLSDDGFAIAIMDVMSDDEALHGLSEIKESGVPVLYMRGDISNAVDRENFVKAVIEEFGRIDILVNNAGVAPRERKDLLEMTEESFQFVVDINIKGTMFLTQLVANKMIELINNGTKIEPVIINISSMSAYTSSVSRGEYCISKAGVSMLTKLYADKLSEYGINVYEIRPGIIYTDMTKVVKDKYDNLIESGLTPIKRWGYTEDIAQAVSAFSSGKFCYSTGEVINVDGGFHLRRL